MSVSHYYKEELFFTQGFDMLSEEGQQKLVETLGSNMAVGVAGGFYEEGYPICFISQFALNNLGMTFSEFMERTGGRFLEAVSPKDRDIFTAPFKEQEESYREYRMVNGKGQEVWMCDFRAESEVSSGRKLWMCAIRVVDSEHRSRELTREAFRMLRDVYFRVSAIDLNADTITDLKLPEGDVPVGAGGLREAAAHWCSRHVLPEYRKLFMEVLSSSYLKEVFAEGTSAPVSFTFEGDIDGNTHWMRSDLLPVEGYGPEDGRVMWYIRNITEEKAIEAEFQDRLLKKSAELYEAKEELEKLNRQMQASNVHLRRTLSEEEQYRQAIISDAILVFNVNVTRNLIEEEFFEIVDGERIAVLPMVGLEAPCSADEFYSRWREQKVLPEDRAIHEETLNMSRLLDNYAHGRDEIVLEYESYVSKETPLVLRHTILLTRDQDSGDVLALNNLKDITTLRREERETRRALIAAYDVATKANNAKTDFLSRMSHTIRTPMNAIIGLTTLAKTHLDDKERIEACLDKICAAGRQMLALVNDALDMNLIESGQVRLSEEAFSLPELMGTVKELFEAGAKEHRHTLLVTCKRVEHPNVVGDKARLQQVLSKLLANAIKYTPDGGKITLELRERRPEESRLGLYEFVCEDNGIGMDESFLTRLFQPFERAEDSRISKVQGTGLGLAIVKNVLATMGGDVQVESAIGKGSRFVVTVPLYLQDGQEAAEKKPEVGEFPMHSYEGKRVLLVDDNELNREIAAEILEMMGLEVELAVNGKEAVERVLRTKPGEYDLILMDIQMPLMNGVEATEAIRATGREDLKSIPIVALSANTLAGDVSAATNAGMNGHLAKPLDLVALNRMLDRWL